MEKSKVKKVKNNCSKTAKQLIIISVFVFVVLILFLVCYFAIKKITSVKKESDFTIVERQLNFCQELVSVKYGYSDVIALKKQAGLAKSYSIIKYSGIIRAGINDINDVSYDVRDDGRTIILAIPPAAILGNEITGQELFDEKQSIFVRISTQDIFDEIEEAKNKTEEKLITKGFLENSWKYAANIIRQFMYGCGFDNVIVKKSSI